MTEFDPGPPPAVAAHLAGLPSYASYRTLFWYDWGPVFYRGRLDGRARVLCIASDPGPTERIAGRTLVGDAGQRVQGFLSKLGLTTNYVCVNAYAYALIPAQATRAEPLLSDPEHRAWRNAFYSMVAGSALQAIVAFGEQAHRALHLWDGAPAVPAAQVPHPSSRDAGALIAAWRDAIITLRAVVTPDPDGDNGGPNYGARFQASDYAPIPSADLPFGVPPWLGDDAWARAARPKVTPVRRPADDRLHTIVWQAPRDQP